MTEFVIETTGLYKSFKSKPALCGLDLGVPAESKFGFLGRNGAGRTTTIKLLMGMLTGSMDWRTGLKNKCPGLSFGHAGFLRAALSHRFSVHCFTKFAHPLVEVHPVNCCTLRMPS